MEWQTVLGWFVLAFFCGSLPFSVWIGRWVMKVDIRRYGDHNPGTANVFRAGGKGWGIAAMALDFFKGAIPVGLAQSQGGLSDWGLAVVAMAPVLGHAFSPLLGFRGGKALATTFGIWAGLTLWQGPVIFGLNLALWGAILTGDGWVIFFGSLGFLAFLLLSHAPAYLIAVGIASMGLLIWKYRLALKSKPVARKWLHKLIQRP